jgi:hypothetical protein
VSGQADFWRKCSQCLDPGIGPQAHQFVSYAAPLEPPPGDGLPRFPERLGAPSRFELAADGVAPSSVLARSHQLPRRGRWKRRRLPRTRAMFATPPTGRA